MNWPYAAAFPSQDTRDYLSETASSFAFPANSSKFVRRITTTPKKNMQKKEMQRKHWIDCLRGFCMLAILLDHTELYYAGRNIIPYNLYVVNALVSFFIISGYLLYKDGTFDIKRKLRSVLRSLLLPYLIFTTVLSIPKSLAHDNSVNLCETAVNILSGQASWFVAALCLSEVIFAVSVWTFRGKDIAVAATGIFGFAISVCLSTGERPYFWQLDNSCQALLFLSMGYLYHKYEAAFDKISKRLLVPVLVILLSLIKIYGHTSNADLMIWYIHITDYPLFIADISVCSLLMILVFKSLPDIKWLGWTGSHCLVYYFMCGGVPLITSTLFNKAGHPYNGNYLYVMAALAMVYAGTTAITYIIYRYFPFAVGKKRG